MSSSIRPSHDDDRRLVRSTLGMRQLTTARGRHGWPPSTGLAASCVDGSTVEPVVEPSSPGRGAGRAAATVAAAPTASWPSTLTRPDRAAHRRPDARRRDGALTGRCLDRPA